MVEPPQAAPSNKTDSSTSLARRLSNIGTSFTQAIERTLPRRVGTRETVSRQAWGLQKRGGRAGRSAYWHFGNCVPVSTSWPCVLPAVTVILRLAMSVISQLAPGMFWAKCQAP